MRPPAIRLLVLLGAAVLLVAGSVFGAASPAAACSCAEAPMDFANDDFVDAVFIGSVTDSYTSGSETNWRFAVDSVLRGDLGPDVNVITPTNGASCGFEGLEIGSERAVLLSDDDGAWRSNLCSIASVEDAAGVGDPAPPNSEISAGKELQRGITGSSYIVPVVIGAIVVPLLAFAIGYTLSKRRRPPPSM